MLTADFDRLGVAPGVRVLDLGSGNGRHSFEAYRRGASLVACDLSRADLVAANATMAAMKAQREVPPEGSFTAAAGDARHLPFADQSFDCVIAAEVLEHVPEDGWAMAEIARVLRPGGRLAVTVPRWFPERVCWALSRAYHSNPGGHVRIYRGSELRSKLEHAGLMVTAAHHAHALHVPYWWIRCVVGIDRATAWLPRQYHRLLVWDIMRRPPALRRIEQALNPILGKSLVLYLQRPSGHEVRNAA